MSKVVNIENHPLTELNAMLNEFNRFETKLTELSVKSEVLFKKLTEAIGKDDAFDREEAPMDWIGRMENLIYSIGRH